MARSISLAYLSTLAAEGLVGPVSASQRWASTTLRMVRSSVLPDPVPLPPAAPTIELLAEAQPHPVRRSILVVALVLVLLVLGMLTFRAAYADRLYPAIIAGDVPVGGLTVAEANARLSERAAELEQGTIAFQYQEQLLTPTLSELGVTILVDRTVANAQHIGRGGNATARLTGMLGILHPHAVIPLRARIDQATLDAWFDKVDHSLGQAPVNARVELVDGAVTIVPGAAGVVVDREAATAHLRTALVSLAPVTVTLPTRISQPGITADALNRVQGEIDALISRPVEARFEDQAWSIEPETVVPYLDVNVTLEAGEPVAHLSIDRAGLARELRIRYTAEVSRKPVDAVLGWDGRLVVVEPSVTGAALRSDAFAGAVGDSFLSDHRPVEVPVVTISPAIDGSDLDRYGITSLLGAGHSNFEGGTWERDENIRIATQLLNGTLVPPGETFSFNRAIGEITAGKGYQEALVVSGDAVGRDVGGGVCQVSTTVFRAALNGGLPITEWYPHTYRLENYERDGWGPGFDASILQWGPDPEAWPDFRFENDTDRWLLVEAYVSDVHVYVNLYGSSDGRSVEISTWPIGGNAFGFTQVVYDAQGKAREERTFESHFK